MSQTYIPHAVRLLAETHFPSYCAALLEINLQIEDQVHECFVWYYFIDGYDESCVFLLS